jgi:fatty acid desaturase
MPKNVGVIDRALRAVVGLILIALAVLGIFAPWGWVGVVPLLTAFIGFCPAYTLLGVKTCSVE